MKKILLSLIAIVFTFGLFSCDKENAAGVGLGNMETDSDYFVLVDDDNTVPDLYDATFETDFCMVPSEYEGSMKMHQYKGKKKDKRPPKGQRFFRFGEIFREMELSDEQIALVPAIIKDHYLCSFEAKLTLRAALEDIFAAAREDRLEIITSFRNGEITREEALQQLTTLNETTRATIQNSDAHAAFEASMCLCFEEMITSIEEILTDEQTAQWQAWLETKTHPCLVD